MRIVLLSGLGKLAGLSLLAALILAAGCSRPLTVEGSTNTRNDQPQAPFQGSQAEAPGSNPEAESRNGLESGIVPHDRTSLPAGTLLTVRLTRPISVDGADAGGTFQAIVDEPVVMDGVALVPRGANAEGRVESARASRLKRNRDSVRLTLDSIDISGRELALQTSSLFASGDGAEGTESDGRVIHLDKGRRLTFRLTGPVRVAGAPKVPSADVAR